MVGSIHDDERTLAPHLGSSASQHDEWLLDEAIRGSFPASDPASSSQPGSIVNKRYARVSSF